MIKSGDVLQKLLLILIFFVLLLLPGCRERDGFVDVGPVMITEEVFPSNLRCPLRPCPDTP